MYRYFNYSMPLLMLCPRNSPNDVTVWHEMTSSERLKWCKFEDLEIWDFLFTSVSHFVSKNRSYILCVMYLLEVIMINKLIITKKGKLHTSKIRRSWCLKVIGIDLKFQHFSKNCYKFWTFFSYGLWSLIIIPRPWEGYEK